MGGKEVHVTADSREESRKAARQSTFSGSYLHTPSPLLFHVKVCLGTCCIVFCSVNSSLPQDIHSLGVWSPHISRERKGLLPALINAGLQGPQPRLPDASSGADTLAFTTGLRMWSSGQLSISLTKLLP